MNKTIQIMMIGLVGFSCILNTACVSSYAYRSSQKEVVEEKVYESGDPEVVKAYHERGVKGVAFDLAALDIIFHSPWTFIKQVGAAAIDAGVTYFAYDQLQEMSDSGDKSGSASKAIGGRDANTVTIIGDGNTTQIRGDVNTVGGSDTSE